LLIYTYQELKNIDKISFPTSLKEMKEKDWEQADIILVSGDAFIDHPSFGIAIIARVLENKGYKVAIIPQPNWKDDLRDFKKFGAPRLFFGVSSGNMDSMINHYTAHKRLRSDDAYTPGGKAGFRPDYALTVYSNILKTIYPTIPVIIGGIEASLRRIVHYDYWSDKIKPSVLIDSKADILVYGMAEKSISEIADRLNSTKSLEQLYDIKQIAYLSTTTLNSKYEHVKIQGFNECIKSKKIFAESFKTFEEESAKYNSKGFIQQQSKNLFLITNPPYPPLTDKEIDDIYNLPFSRNPHPKYLKKDPIPAFDMIKNSITIHRGCFGGCSFCALAVHQGKFIASRSHKSILNEISLLINQAYFSGHISDLGGPSANMYGMTPIDLNKCQNCKRPSCIFPYVCANLNDNPDKLIELYKKARELKDIKLVSIGSGIRYDMLLNKKSKYFATHNKYLKDLIRYHVSGRLKVAPEHSSTAVLKIMRKQNFDKFLEFKALFEAISKQEKINQQIIPYYISSHPGCKLSDMYELAENNKFLRIFPEQVQDFIPTPMTLSSVIFHTGINPYTNEQVFVEKNLNEKKKQKDSFFTKSKRKNN